MNGPRLTLHEGLLSFQAKCQQNQKRHAAIFDHSNSLYSNACNSLVFLNSRSYCMYWQAVESKYKSGKRIILSFDMVIFLKRLVTFYFRLLFKRLLKYWPCLLILRFSRIFDKYPWRKINGGKGYRTWNTYCTNQVKLPGNKLTRSSRKVGLVANLKWNLVVGCHKMFFAVWLALVTRCQANYSISFGW